MMMTKKTHLTKSDDGNNDDDRLSSDEEPDDTLVADIMLSKHEDEVVDGDESDKSVPDKDEILISEVVMQMNKKESREKDNPQDNGLDYNLFSTNMMGEADNGLTNDLPSCLVDDCNSVCQPCADNPNNTDQTNKGMQTDNGINNDTRNMWEEQINKWKLWKTMEGNGILNTNKLQCKMVANLLCLKCMVEKLSGNVDICSIEFAGAMLDINI